MSETLKLQRNASIYTKQGRCGKLQPGPLQVKCSENRENWQAGRGGARARDKGTGGGQERGPREEGKGGLGGQGWGRGERGGREGAGEGLRD